MNEILGLCLILGIFLAINHFVRPYKVRKWGGIAMCLSGWAMLFIPFRYRPEVGFNLVFLTLITTGFFIFLERRKFEGDDE
ncbi:hypothetical protein [Pseudomonas putida]